MKYVATDADFSECILSETTVEVFFDGEKEDKGKIEFYTEESFKINGFYYIRECCTVFVKESITH